MEEGEGERNRVLSGFNFPSSCTSESVLADNNHHLTNYKTLRCLNRVFIRFVLIVKVD